MRSGLSPLKLSEGEIANADEANLALIHQLFHGTHRFLGGKGRVRPASPVTIDMIRFACLKTTSYALGRTLGTKSPRGSCGCQERLIADTRNALAHDTLG